ncbi:MAG: endonuclease domain-containing protein [Saprospiraceae bacterium]|nr:endonuclease domain-containing protein [Saprospiraceae bacterium]
MNTRDFSRVLRKTMTREEALLWQQVRNRQLDGYKFRRQHPIEYVEENGWRSSFIADFYCAEKRLIIELDGAVHDGREDYDEMRTHMLIQLGYRVCRIKNSMCWDMPRVLELIRGELNI